MTNENYTVRVLRADEGCMLTQAVPPAELEKTVITDVLYLARTDDPANWREIPLEEAETIRGRIRSLEEARTKESAE